ncbi:unnamed protein product [Ranitomeya imitator]|uniref:Uncharacterized protein n=1 Tax=Ranitomeya imitator TaxID=111125 RepID=A0ABN9KQR5_9NEOB|nr:unnamed protein product [Ranitomeya imitator]
MTSDDVAVSRDRFVITGRSRNALLGTEASRGAGTLRGMQEVLLRFYSEKTRQFLNVCTYPKSEATNIFLPDLNLGNNYLLFKKFHSAFQTMESVEMTPISLKRHLTTEDLAVDEAKRQKLSENNFTDESVTGLQETVQTKKAILTETVAEENGESEEEERLEGEPGDGDTESFADMMKHGLTELDVGITKFVSSHEGRKKDSS